MNGEPIDIICLREPDISYTSNRKLETGKRYRGILRQTKIGDTEVLTYDVFEEGHARKLGTYFAIDFMDTQQYRDSMLEEILG